MTIGIYMIINTMNNKKYIGQSVNIKRRKSEHFTKHCNKMVISNAIFKHGKENFDFEILEECDESQLNELEIKYITEYETHVSLGKGYNQGKGGNGVRGEDHGMYGRKHSPESIQKMKDSMIGKSGHPHTEEHKEYIKNELLGTGILYRSRVRNESLTYVTKFNHKIKEITVNKYKDLSIPLIIFTRICMENEIDFKSNLVKDIENFVQKFDLKTINIIN